MFETIVLQAKSLGIIEGNDVAIDSSEYESYDKAVLKSKMVDDGKIQLGFQKKVPMVIK